MLKLYLILLLGHTLSLFQLVLSRWLCLEPEQAEEEAEVHMILIQVVLEQAEEEAEKQSLITKYQ